MRIEWQSDPKKPKFVPRFEPGLLGQKAIALPLALPPWPRCTHLLTSRIKGFDSEDLDSNPQLEEWFFCQERYYIQSKE